MPNIAKQERDRWVNRKTHFLPETPTDKANQAKVRAILKEVMGSAPKYSNRHKTCRTYKYLYGQYEKEITILDEAFRSQNLPARAECGTDIVSGLHFGLKVRVDLEITKSNGYVLEEDDPAQQ